MHTKNFQNQSVAHLSYSQCPWLSDAPELPDGLAWSGRNFRHNTPLPLTIVLIPYCHNWEVLGLEWNRFFFLCGKVFVWFTCTSWVICVFLLLFFFFLITCIVENRYWIEKNIILNIKFAIKLAISWAALLHEKGWGCWLHWYTLSELCL